MRRKRFTGSQRLFGAMQRTNRAVIVERSPPTWRVPPGQDSCATREITRKKRCALIAMKLTRDSVCTTAQRSNPGR